MTLTLRLVLLVLAVVCFTVAAFSVNTGRFNCVNAGFALVTAAFTFG